MPRSARLLAVLFLCVFLGLLYARTLAPGLTWAFDGADGGDLITAAATGGVPHPTGYPTYLVLAAVFLRIPIGTLAFRTNLLSLSAAVLSAALIYALVLRTSQSVFAASVAGIGFGTAPLVWSQAIITEVYTLQALLTVFFLTLLVGSRPRRFIEVALGVVAGLGLGNHMMGALLLPLLLLRPQAPSRAIATTADGAPVALISLPTVYLQRLVGLAAGLAIYLLLPLRASSHSAVNWENVNSPQTLLSLVSGQMYWSRLQHSSPAYLITGARSWANLMSSQLTVPGLLLASLGLIVIFRPRILHIATVWITISSSLFAILYYSPDSYVYLIPAIVSSSIWIGLGSHWLMERASGHVAYGAAVAMLVVLGFFILRGIRAVPSMDLSGDRRAEDFARTVLTSAPKNAILVTEGDESTFALWYFHYALHKRPDVSVVSGDLLTQAWYHEVLRYTYADLVVPSEAWTSALALANPGRRVCAVTSILPPRLDCAGEATSQAWRTQGV